MASEAFSPGGAAVSVASSGSSSAATALGGGGRDIRVWNSSTTNAAFVEFGASDVGAASASSYPLPPGLVEIIRDPGTSGARWDYVRVYSTSATVYFVRGTGI